MLMFFFLSAVDWESETAVHTSRSTHTYSKQSSYPKQTKQKKIRINKANNSIIDVANFWNCSQREKSISIHGIFSQWIDNLFFIFFFSRSISLCANVDVRRTYGGWTGSRHVIHSIENSCFKIGSTNRTNEWWKNVIFSDMKIKNWKLLPVQVSNKRLQCAHMACVTATIEMKSMAASALNVAIDSSRGQAAAAASELFVGGDGSYFGMNCATSICETQRGHTLSGSCHHVTVHRSHVLIKSNESARNAVV